MPAFFPPEGPAGLRVRGAWNPLIDYTAGDGVTHDGSFWLRLITGTTPDAPEDDAVNWVVLAAQGAEGPEGPAGNSVFPALAVKAQGSLTIGTASSHVLDADSDVIWREFQLDTIGQRVSLKFGTGPAVLDSVKTIREQGDPYETANNEDLHMIASAAGVKVLYVEFVVA